MSTLDDYIDVSAWETNGQEFSILHCLAHSQNTGALTICLFDDALLDICKQLFRSRKLVVLPSCRRCRSVCHRAGSLSSTTEHPVALVELDAD